MYSDTKIFKVTRKEMQQAFMTQIVGIKDKIAAYEKNIASLKSLDPQGEVNVDDGLTSVQNDHKRRIEKSQAEIKMLKKRLDKFRFLSAHLVDEEYFILSASELDEFGLF